MLVALLWLSSCSWAKTSDRTGNDVGGMDAQRASFGWRSIYSPTSAEDAKACPKTSMHVDWCWGLWGHNMQRVFADGRSTDTYAVIDGRRDKSQFCFSSPDTYSGIEGYILDQYGEGSAAYHERICVIPNDNMHVCACLRCRKMGCTARSATPAVAALVAKLAKRFPQHIFFMAGYNTTLEAPEQRMPDNVGVLLSTMDIPMQYGFADTEGLSRFDTRLKDWQKAVATVYVWEYSRNFDDYLSPYPCLSIMQRRLRYYRDNGITGVFVNGSGYDYSSFDDVQTRVLDSLMKDTDQDIDHLITSVIRRLYPQTAESVAALYMTMEKTVREKNIRLPYYGTVDDEMGYIDAEAFNKQWKDLDRLSKSVKGQERKRLAQLLTALAFTRMELTRVTGDRSEFDDILEVLSGFVETENMQNYREANGSLDAYVSDCKKNRRAPEINERR